MIGRAARNVDARVVLYADKETDSMKRALAETNRRREMQVRFNEENGIVPKQIVKPVKEKEVEVKDVLFHVGNTVAQFPQFSSSRGWFDTKNRVRRFGGSVVMRPGTNTANPCRDSRHFLNGLAQAKLFKASQF